MVAKGNLSEFDKQLILTWECRRAWSLSRQPCAVAHVTAEVYLTGGPIVGYGKMRPRIARKVICRATSRRMCCATASLAITS
jgi:hypothetical protein